MNKEFIKRAVMMPLCAAFVFGVILSIYFKVNVDKFIPLFNNTQYAYHGEIVKNKNEKDSSVDKAEYQEDPEADPSTFEKNQCIGAVKVGKGYPIRYDMDYSKIQKAISYVPQSVPFGEIGFTYLYSGNKNAKEIAKVKDLTIGSVFGEKHYVYKNTESFDNEFGVLNYAPECESAVIIYYRESVSAGFTSQYIAMVYEEVK